MTMQRPTGALDELAAEVLDLDPDELAALLATLEPDEVELIDLALSTLEAEAWRTDPSFMGAHLDPAGYTRWGYVALLGEKFRQAVEGESIRQLWMMPARYGKTLNASVWGPVWGLDRYPWLRLILTSYGAELAEQNSASVRDLIDLHASALRVKVHPRKRASKRWWTTEGGQVLAAGVGGAMTGFGGDVIVIDDAFKNYEEASSEANRKKVWNWYKSVVYLRRQTEQSAIIVAGTRWHEQDLQGLLLKPPDGEEPEEWDVVRLPALAEAPNPDGPAWEQLPDPLGRAPGEPLEPGRFTKAEVLRKHRVLGSYLTAAMEQQRPSSAEGGIFKRKWWRQYTTRPVEADDWQIVWDSSFADKKDSSYCVGALWARVGSRKLLVDLVRDRMDYPTFKRTVVSFAKKWPQARVVRIEDKANGPAVLADLRGTVSGMVPYTPQGSKESRARAVSADVEAGDVLLPDPGIDDPKVDRSFVHEFINEHAQFPTGSHDDQVDTTTMALLQWTNADVVPTEESYNPRQAQRGRR